VANPLPRAGEQGHVKWGWFRSNGKKKTETDRRFRRPLSPSRRGAMGWMKLNLGFDGEIVKRALQILAAGRIRDRPHFVNGAEKPGHHGNPLKKIVIRLRCQFHSSRKQFPTLAARRGVSRRPRGNFKQDSKTMTTNSSRDHPSLETIAETIASAPGPYEPKEKGRPPNSRCQGAHQHAAAVKKEERIQHGRQRDCRRARRFISPCFRKAADLDGRFALLQGKWRR